MTSAPELLTYYGQKAALATLSRLFRPAFAAAFPAISSPRTDPDDERISSQLALFGVGLTPFNVDEAAYRTWLDEANYSRLAYLANRDEKFLEHFVSVELLELRPHALLIDVASCRSQFPDVMRRRGHRVIAQDLSYPHGLHGDRLGGDAADMAMPDGSVDGMTLHCSFEHFENDADSRFVREAARVLRPGGRCVILPLYLHHQFLIETDPIVTWGKLKADPGATIVSSHGYVNRHGRHYDVAHLKSRVLTIAAESGLEARIFRVENSSEISPNCYLRYALVLEKMA